jgi:hypothetical protein
MLARTWAELPNSVVSSKAVSNRWLALRTALRSHRPCRNRIGTLNEQIELQTVPQTSADARLQRSRERRASTFRREH